MIYLRAKLGEVWVYLPSGHPSGHPSLRSEVYNRLLQERGEAFYEGEETLEWTELINSLVIN